MAYLKAQPFKPQFFNSSTGDLLNGGTIEFYVWDTTTPTPIYSDSVGTSGGTSLTLNSAGKPEIDLFFDTDIEYKLVLKDASGTTIDTIGPFQQGELTQGGGGSTNWTSATDGSGSGLDADLLDGQQGTYYLDCVNFTGNLAPARLAANSIDAEAKLASDSIDKAKMKANSVGTSQIEDSAVTTAKIDDGAVTAAKLATGASIPDSSITTAKIVDSAVTTAKINNTSVTGDKIFPGTYSLFTVGVGGLSSATIASSQDLDPGVYEYVDFTINSGVTVTKTANRLGPLIIKCTGTFTCNGNIVCKNYDSTGDIGGSGGGGGGSSIQGDGAAGANSLPRLGGAGGTSNNNGTVGEALETSAIQLCAQTGNLIKGGAPGGAAANNTNPVGEGGGVLIIIAQSFVFTPTTFLDCSGNDGGTQSSRAGNGGGGGGAILICYSSLVSGSYSASSYDVTGGSGGAGDGAAGDGGAGGDGKIYFRALNVL